MQPCLASVDSPERPLRPTRHTASTAIITLILCLGAAPDTSPKDVALDEASTLKYFAPKLSLGMLRFVVCQNDRLYCELSTPSDMAYALVTGAGAEYVPQQPFDLGIPALLEKRALEFIPERLGDKYTLFYPEHLSFDTRKLVALVARFQGAETYDGLVGRLDGAPPAWAKGRSNMVIGLAQLGAFATKAHAETMRPPDSRPNPEDILAALRAVGVHGELSVEREETLFLRFPETIGVLATIRERDGNAWLACLHKLGQSWKAVPYVGLEYAVAPDRWRILVDEVRPESGYTFAKSTVSVLPDVDGDGASEFLVLSGPTAVLLAAIRNGDHGGDGNEFRIVEIHGISFAA